jgi:hypothetical protein
MHAGLVGRAGGLAGGRAGERAAGWLGDIWAGYWGGTSRVHRSNLVRKWQARDPLEYAGPPRLRSAVQLLLACQSLQERSHKVRFFFSSFVISLLLSICVG